MPEAKDTPVPLSTRFAAEGAFAVFVLRQQRRRDDLLGGDHFSNPIWDMMLDLFAARVHDKDVAVSSLIVAAGIPQSTALRHMRNLVRRGMFVTRDDPQDGRRTFIGLTDEAFERLGQCLRQMIVASRDFHRQG